MPYATISAMLMLPDFRVRQRDFLLQIARAITAQLDLSEVLRRVLHASIAMMAGNTGLVALRAPDGEFYVRAVSAIPTELIPMLDQRLSELVSTLESEPDTELMNDKLREMAHEIDPELRQSIALPLAFASQPLGLLIVFRTYRSAVSQNDLQVLQSFADQAAIAVNNAQLYEAINHERTRLEAILNHSADGIMILAPDRTILRCNPALERLTGWSAQEAVGRSHDEVLALERVEPLTLKDAMAEGWPFEGDGRTLATLDVEGDLALQDGSRVSLSITYAPMLNSDRVTNIVANVRDITHFRQAQEMQNVFISGISHELKTPVAIIKGYAATLRRDDVAWDQRTREDSLSVIEEEADRLTDLIQNLLTASKLQVQRELMLDIIQDVALDDLAARALERFETQTTQHRFVIDFPPDFPLIEGDAARLRQVLDNLIGNAIKYSPQGGTVRVIGKHDRHKVTVAVQDEGVGLSERDKERVFERFFRVDSKLSRRTQGTGLGLYLAKAIIEAHHGAIGVESALGKGSRFFFSIPIRQPSTDGAH